MVRVLMEWYTSGSIGGRECRVPSLEKGWDHEELLIETEVIDLKEIAQVVLIWFRRFFRHSHRSWICDWNGYVSFVNEDAIRLIMSLKVGVTIGNLLTAKCLDDFLVIGVTSPQAAPRLDPNTDDTS